MKNYVVGTDGLCKNNQKAGGQKGTWAFVVFNEDKKIIGGKSGHNPSTTNNEMEGFAILEALKWANKYRVAIQIHSDSDYMVKAITVWSNGWVRNGWKTSGGKPVANKELIQNILAELRPWHSISWVKGHAGNPVNEAADSRCNEEYINAFI